MQASDGNFYGTTASGGTADYGTVFRLTPAGALTTLHSFCTQSGCPDGATPVAGLVQASDGYLYGTNGCTIFQVGLDGSFATVYDFCSQPNYADGTFPNALIQATDGNLYGTTSSDGEHKYGTIFKITTGGTLTTLYNFCSLRDCHDGAITHGPVFQATDGNFYGATFGFGGGTGVVFRLSVGLDPFVTPLPAQGNIGAKVRILGTGLAGATAVTFNGTPAPAFTVNSTGSAITVTVPRGATSGPVQVTLAGGATLSGNVPFEITRR